MPTGMAKFRPNNESSPPNPRMRDGAPNLAKAIGDWEHRKSYVDRHTEQKLREACQTAQSEWLTMDRLHRRGGASEVTVKRLLHAYGATVRAYENFMRTGSLKPVKGKAKQAESVEARDARLAAEAAEAKTEFDTLSAKVVTLPKGSDERRQVATAAREARTKWLALTGGVERVTVEVSTGASSWDEKK